MSEIYQSDPDAEHRFFVFDPETRDFYYFASAADRDEWTEGLFDSFDDGDGFDEAVEQIVAGEMTHTAQLIPISERKDFTDAEWEEEHGTRAAEWDAIYECRLIPVIPAIPSPESEA